MTTDSDKVRSENKNTENLLALHTRKDFQFPRRLFHFGNGAIVGTLYLLFFSYQTMLQIIGTIACLVYIADQLRLSYPKVSKNLLPFTKLIMRAEEQLKESAMVPYAIAILLTMITFPKLIAVIGIFTLAIADPLSAIIGIRYGGRFFPKIVSHKSLEGSAAFFLATFAVTFYVLSNYLSVDYHLSVVIFLSFVTAFLAAGFEMLPLKIDDNLSIPLFTSAILWVFSALCSVQVI